MSEHDALTRLPVGGKLSAQLVAPRVCVPEHEYAALTAERDALIAYARELEGELRRRGIPWGEVLLGGSRETIDGQIDQIRQRHGVDILLI